MNRTIALVLLATAPSYAASADRCTPLRASDYFDVVRQVEDADLRALTEYFFGTPAKSLPLLDVSVDISRSSQCTNVVPEEAVGAFQYRELLARARLVRVLRALGNEKRAAAELSKAVSLGKSVLARPSFSEADLFAMIDEVDPKMRANMLREHAVRE